MPKKITGGCVGKAEEMMSNRRKLKRPIGSRSISYAKQAAPGRFMRRPDFDDAPVWGKTWATKEEAVAEVMAVIRKTGWEPRIVEDRVVELPPEEELLPWREVEIGTFCPHGVSVFDFNLSDDDDGTWSLSEGGAAESLGCECGDYTLPKGWIPIR
jgi:hypothetical protein